ncbi:MAG: hypothetical protein ABSE62_15100 [Chthoniobacteraceae bacterium]
MNSRTGSFLLPGAQLTLLLITLLLPMLARAVDFDATGVVLKNGGTLRITGTTPVPPAQIYSVTMDLSGTASGEFANYLGSGPINLRAALTGSFGSFTATNVLGATLANLSGTFPATLATGAASQYYYPMITSTSYQTVRAAGDFSLKISKHGIFTGSITHQSYGFYVGTKRHTITGSFVATSGTVSVSPVAATGTTAQPDIMFLSGPHVILGCQVYFTTPDGTIPPFYTGVAKGSTHTTTFLVQNDGPSTDTFLFESGSIPSGFSVVGYDGKTKITPATLSGTGYPITLASGALKAINVKITTGSHAAAGYYFIPFSAQRSVDDTSTDWASAALYVP